MARLNTVKSAQQRYRMVPVMENGVPKTTPVMKRDGVTPKTNKNGRAITRRVTVADKTQPLADRKCGKCGDAIPVGSGYRWWANKLPGSSFSQKSIRCMKSECYPKPWDMTPGRAGELMRAEAELDEALSGNFEELGDVESAMEAFAGTVREIGEGLIESADNIESGFEHETYQSQELRERGDNLINQADELESTDFDDPPEMSDFEGECKENCPECDGEGEITPEGEEEPETCATCNGSGEVDDESAAEQAYADAMEEWRDDCRSKASEAASEVDLG